MLRILFFLVLVFALGVGFAWLADRPGDMVVTFDGYQYQVSLMVAAVIVTAITAAVMLTWWLAKSIWSSPYTVARYFRVRRRDRGYQALSTGMIAAGAGDAELARKKKKEAMKLISADQEPLIHLLDAQASLLEGNHEGARAKFEAMLADPETRLLGLRGLYLEAERLGDRQAARHYAERAAEVAPQLGWAAESTLEQKAEAGQWNEALRIVDAQKSTRQIQRETAHRRKAVLLTAKARDLLDADPTGAKTAALEAVRLAPELVPASVVAARALFRLGDIRKGAKIIETAWKLEPHPELADAYVHARPGDSTHDRLERARKLQSLRRNNVESSLAVARAALDAGEYGLARREAETAARLGSRESVFLLLADIEEAETGDQGKIRQWLGRAVRAPRDPAWTADGSIFERWVPISPISGRLDAIEWRSQGEKQGQIVDQSEGDQPVAPAQEDTAAAASATVPALLPTSDSPVEEAVIVDEKPVAAAPTPPPPVTAHAAAAASLTSRPATEGPAMVVSARVVDAAPPEAPDDDVPAQHPIRLPDDPGVDADEKELQPGGFRLF